MRGPRSDFSADENAGWQRTSAAGQKAAVKISRPREILVD
jgi:hypothetical protein